MLAKWANSKRGRRRSAAIVIIALLLSTATLMVWLQRMWSKSLQRKGIQQARENARQQRHVTYRRISDCQEEETSRRRQTSKNNQTNNGDDYAAFFCTLPTPDNNGNSNDDDDDDWMMQSRPPTNSDPYCISTLVPGLPSDVDHNLPTLLKSIFLQTRPASEIIIVISDLQNITQFSYESGVQWCQQTHQTLVSLRPQQQPYTTTHNQQQQTTTTTTTSIKLICLAERLTAGRARNVAAQLASSHIFSFIDADDTEFPQRNHVIRNMFQCHHDHLRVFLHSYVRNYGDSKHPYDVQRRKRGDQSKYGYIPDDGECADQETHVQVLRYEQLQEILATTQRRLWLNFEVAHGHVVLHRSVVHQHHYRFNTMAYGEDSVFCRDVLWAYGRQDKAVVFLNRPLTTYYEIGHRGEELFEEATR